MADSGWIFGDSPKGGILWTVADNSLQMESANINQRPASNKPEVPQSSFKICCYKRKKKMFLALVSQVLRSSA